jgi:hypothetical protein
MNIVFVPATNDYNRVGIRRVTSSLDQWSLVEKIACGQTCQCKEATGTGVLVVVKTWHCALPHISVKLHYLSAQELVVKRGHRHIYLDLSELHKLLDIHMKAHNWKKRWQWRVSNKYGGVQQAVITIGIQVDSPQQGTAPRGPWELNPEN